MYKNVVIIILTFKFCVLFYVFVRITCLTTRCGTEAKKKIFFGCLWPWSNESKSLNYFFATRIWVFSRQQSTKKIRLDTFEIFCRWRLVQKKFAWSKLLWAAKKISGANKKFFSCLMYAKFNILYVHCSLTFSIKKVKWI